jgi:hypothetical protein
MFVAVVEEALEQLVPAVVAPQESEPRHELQPDQREGHVGVGGVAVRQHVAHHEMRRCDRALADHHHRLRARLRLRQVRVEQLHQFVVLAAEERHVGEHLQHVERRRACFGGERVLISDADERLLRQR